MDEAVSQVALPADATSAATATGDKHNSIAIAGASGFVGRALCQHLAGGGHRVVALSRRQQAADAQTGEVWRQANMFNLRHVERALTGARVGLYLVHSMAPTARLSQGSFADLDLICADNFARAARAAGLERIIYLGGLLPEARPLSVHLQSRLETEQALASHGLPVTTLRAGLIVGRGGSSCAMMLKLVQRLPVMVLPKWTSSKCQPIALSDVLRLLTYCIEHENTAGQTFDIGGPEVMTYRQMLAASATALGKKRRLITVPMAVPKLSLGWVSLVTGSPLELVAPLVTSLRHDMVVHQPGPKPAFAPQHCVPFAQALQQAIAHDDTRGMARRRTTVTDALKPTATVLRARGVVSVQRLYLPQGKDARFVAQLYGQWLPRGLWRLLGLVLKVAVVDGEHDRPEVVSFMIRGTQYNLLRLEHSAARSGPNRQLYYIAGGLLARPTGAEEPGRFEFRVVLGGRHVLAAIHDFVPRLPWLLYKYTQALVHSLVMRGFNRALRRVDHEREP